ncbi:MAG: hypothetical protein N3D85_03820 [Candidatus Bathyarchaeota archaeon]|nr:hypothetical protein [Candidatus Bathyarchaeota archaeon]
MEKLCITVFLLLNIVALSVAPLASAQTLTPPNVSLPGGWRLESQKPYPEAPSEYDEAGAGMLQYVNPQNYDEVRIYYERAPSRTFSSSELKREAEHLFDRDLTDEIQESGTMQLAGTTAGFAKAYDAQEDAYLWDIVFIKDNYYLNVLAYHAASSQSQNEVMSILNSISSGGLFSGTMLYIIIGLVIAIVVIIIVTVVALQKRKKTASQFSPQNYTPPPPPTP